MWEREGDIGRGGEGEEGSEVPRARTLSSWQEGEKKLKKKQKHKWDRERARTLASWQDGGIIICQLVFFFYVLLFVIIIIVGNADQAVQVSFFIIIY